LGEAGVVEGCGAEAGGGIVDIGVIIYGRSDLQNGRM
jgi:hypothetical protein